MKFGSFEGEVVTQWLLDPNLQARTMKLMNSFKYTEPSERVWTAPVGRSVDGASIPEFLWSIAGSPFTGNYRRATVIHDIACQDKPHTSDIAHKAFYLAMKCDKTDEWTARLFYLAVLNFGPQWDVDRSPLPQTHENIIQFRKMTMTESFITLPLGQVITTSRQILMDK
jgi:hypothetical protein